MVHVSPLEQFLQLMENPVNVIALALTLIVLRLIWARVFVQTPTATPSPEPKWKEKRKRLAAQTTAESTPPRQKKDVMLEVFDTLIIAAILVFGIIRPFFLQTFYIPSASMRPILQENDKLIANKFVYLLREPRRGEVIVFKPPIEAVVGNNLPLTTRRWLQENPGRLNAQQLNALRGNLVDYLRANRLDPGWLDSATPLTNDKDLLAILPVYPKRWDDYIKRVIGVPGDAIRIVAGDGIYINGHKLRETERDGQSYEEGHTINGNNPSYLNFPLDNSAEFSMPENMSEDEVVNFAAHSPGWYIYAYTFNKSIKPNLQVILRPGQSQPHVEFVVPPHAVFVMGDNRTEGSSFDSRYWGVVPYANIKGRAVSTFWPLNRLRLL